jgi:transaldolase
LIYPNSVNTAPLGTIEDWLKDGKKEQSVIISEDECDKYFKSLEQNGIKLNDVYEKLLNEGLDAFKVSFKELLSKLKH